MNRYERQYLRDINQLLGGGIRRAVGADGMLSRQLWCMQQLVASLAAEHATDAEAGQGVLAFCREQLPGLRELLSDETGRRLLDRLEQHCGAVASSEVATDLAGIAGRLGSIGDDPRATAMLAKLVAADAAHWQHVDAEVARLSAPLAAQDRETEPFTPEGLAQLTALLREQCAEAPQLAIAKTNALAGGFSKQTIMVTLTGNRVLPSEIVVRRDRAESPVGSTVVDEFELLKTLYDAGVAVPQPYALDTGSVSGAPLMVVSRLPGRIIGDPYDVFERDCPGVTASLARQLARVHRVPLSRLTRPLAGHDRSQRDHLRADIEEFRRHWRAENEASVVIEAAFEWLDARFDDLPTEGRCITHRDMRFHNILVDEERVSAILDWETAALGRPARDLGFAYRHVVQLGGWTEFADAYRADGGELPNNDELAFYRLWADLLMTIWMYRARASYLASDGGNIQLAFAGERMRQHNLRILSETLSELLGAAATAG